MTAPNRALRLLWACVTAGVIGGTGFLDAIESRVDYVAALASPHDRAAAQIALVPIEEQDYTDPGLFATKRPLEPATLRRLIEMVAAHQPAVIGVDVDTSPEVFATFRSLDPALPIVWARSVLASLDVIEPAPLLGFRRVEVEGDFAMPSGIALAPDGANGIVRSYVRRFETSFGDLPSFACAIISRCGRNPNCAADLAAEVRSCGRAPAGRAWQIDYRVASQSAWAATAMSAGKVLEGSVAGSEFRDRIVLIGGTFEVSGDVDHPTPLGKVAGIELLAHVLATELRGGGSNPGGPIATGILIAFETYLILAVFSTPSRRRRIVGAVIVVVGVAALISLVNEYDLSRTGHFVVILLSMLVLQVLVRYVERSQEMFVDWWRAFMTRSSPSS